MFSRHFFNHKRACGRLVIDLSFGEFRQVVKVDWIIQLRRSWQKWRSNYVRSSKAFLFASCGLGAQKLSKHSGGVVFNADDKGRFMFIRGMLIFIVEQDKSKFSATANL